MPKVSIITDTDSSLPNEMAKKYKILQVPISIYFDEGLSGTDHTISNEALFKKIDETGKLPTTAAPTPGIFMEYFKKAFQEENPDTLIYFSISGEMSATIKSAQIAAENLKSDYDIRVVDSNMLSMAQGFMVLAAAEAVWNGASVEESIQAAEKVRRNTVLYGALSTLKYLTLSGRVSHVAAGMASMLNIKPILSVQNGKLEMLEKVRTKKKSWERMIELAKVDVGSHAVERAAVLHVYAEDAAKQFAELLRSELDCPIDMPIIDFNPGLSVHTGAGLVGVCLVID
ncbi:MAG: DegV family protein [Anaerolineaceae bacterium]|nr:DegV family protein [Anaerolineaceae bacterium]